MSIIGVNGKIGSGKDTVGKIIQYLTSEYRDKYNFIEWQDRVENYGSSTYSPFEIKKFAGKLKTIASLLTGIDVKDFEDQEFKNTYLGPEWVTFTDIFSEEIGTISSAHEMTVREFLQKLGTEAMRDGLHINVWVNALFADYKAEESWLNVQLSEKPELVYPNWIITDMRFPNELEAVEEREGVTIRVVRPCSECGGIGYHKMSCSKQYPKQHASETALDDAEFDYEIINDGSIKDLIEKVKQILITEKII
jgi:hypothetical protein